MSTDKKNPQRFHMVWQKGDAGQKGEGTLEKIETHQLPTAEGMEQGEKNTH
jgi:hypothetical protein